MLINDKQLAVAKYSYDPFGNLLAKAGPLADANTYRFSSKEYHQPSGLIYYGFRFYDPNLQRWPNQDPLGEEGGINLYGFVGNSSINFVDPFGLAEHHYVVGPIRFDPEVSPEARSVFRQCTTGDVGKHDYSRPHPQYNQGVEDLWKDWMKGKDKSKLSGAQAQEFVDKVKASPDPRIKNFLKDLEKQARKQAQAKQKALRRLNSRMAKLKALAAAGIGAGAVSALDSLAENPYYQEALSAARCGDAQGVDNAIFELASDVAVEAGDERIVPLLYGPWWWLQK